MKIELLMSKLFGFSPQTYFNWKKDEYKRPILKLLSQYFSKEELEEFLKNNKINRLEKINFIAEEIFGKSKSIYLNSFKKYNTLMQFGDIFIDFYFNFLIFLNSKSNFYNYDIYQLINEYSIFNSLETYQKKVNTNTFDEKMGMISIFSNFEQVNKNIDIFKNWDSNMLLFLYSSFEYNFTNLIHKEEKETALFSIIGFIIYKEEKSLSSEIKLAFTYKIFESLKNENCTKLDIEKLIALKKAEFYDQIMYESTSNKHL